MLVEISRTIDRAAAFQTYGRGSGDQASPIVVARLDHVGAARGAAISAGDAKDRRERVVLQPRMRGGWWWVHPGIPRCGMYGWLAGLRGLRGLGGILSEHRRKF